MPEPKKDVFLSFNSDDRECVEKIAQYLEDHQGLHPWFDAWDLIPGEGWIEKLHRGLAESLTCAVFIGKNGVGPWQKREVETALIKYTNNPDFRVIPVLLPDVPDHPDLFPFLPSLTWVAFRKGLDDNNALERLACGIRRVAPGRPASPNIAIPHDLTQPENFDLGPLVMQFKNILWRKQGLVGFTVHYPSYLFLDVFCKRLEYEYRLRRIRRYETPLQVNSTCMSVDRVIKILKGQKEVLKRQDLLIGIVSEQAALAQNVWQLLGQEFSAEPLRHRLIAIFAVEPACQFPEQVVPLDPPCFTVADVDTWVNNIVEKIPWAEEGADVGVIAEQWTTLIIEECQLRSELELDVGMVYAHLNEMIPQMIPKPSPIGMIQKRSVAECIRQLEERRQSYVQNIKTQV